MSGQSPRHVALVRPHHFRPNPQTAADNAFQHELASAPGEVAARARAEVDGLVAMLEGAGVGVTVVDDEGTTTPDSVFPNNWLSTHEDGTLVLYPMYAKNRRPERRRDLVDDLSRRFAVRRVLDYSGAEREGRFLEGTGAMVLDHVKRLAYACRSRRLDPALFRRACAELGYSPVLFEASDADGMPVYHTNVLMSVGSELALVGAEMIRDPQQRDLVLETLRRSGKEVLELSEAQVHGFAGNCLELQGSEGALLAISEQGAAQLSPAQRRRIERSCQILAAPVPTIEAAGGSVRCMLAGIHLPPRQAEVGGGIPDDWDLAAPAAV